MARWRIRLAKHYQGRLAIRRRPNDELSSGDATVVQASFRDAETAALAASDVPPTATSPESIAYWSDLQSRSDRLLRDYYRLFRERAAAPSQAPLRMGKVLAGTPSASQIAWCLLASLVATIGYAGWMIAVPRRRWPDPDSPATAEPLPEHQLRLEIPAAWVQLHQPWSVRLRETSLIATVIAATLCLLI
jgi:hypothetical protein